MEKMRCAYCKKPASSTCSRCRKTVYCSKGCLAKHWPNHKSQCVVSLPSSQVVKKQSTKATPKAVAPKRVIPKAATSAVQLSRQPKTGQAYDPSTFANLMEQHILLTIAAAEKLKAGVPNVEVNAAVQALLAQLNDWDVLLVARTGNAQAGPALEDALREHSLAARDLIVAHAAGNNAQIQSALSALRTNADQRIKPLISSLLTGTPAETFIANLARLFDEHLRCTNDYLTALAATNNPLTDRNYGQATEECIQLGIQFGQTLDAAIAALGSPQPATVPDDIVDEDEFEDLDEGETTVSDDICEVCGSPLKITCQKRSYLTKSGEGPNIYFVECACGFRKRHKKKHHVRHRR